MKNKVYTFVDKFVSDPTLFAFTRDDLPGQDPDSDIVRFGSVTPKQRFEADTHEDVKRAIWDSALIHFERALEHLAAARWILKEAPTHVSHSKSTKMVKARVTLPVGHDGLTEKDFAHARAMAGSLHGTYPARTVYLGQVGSTTDGRPQHEFEVTYTWQEVTDD